AAPVTIASLALNHAILHLFFRRELRGALVASEGVRVFDAGSALVLFVIVAAAVAYTIGADLAWTAAGGCALLLVLRRELPPEEIWRRIDGPILLFFAGLFVVVEGFVESGAPAWLFSRFELLPDTDLGSFMRLAGFFLVGSNVVSNVPFILVVREPLETISNPESVWTLLALASTFAGNLTLLGSVANIIVAERSRDVGSFGFWEHLRVGFPLALATTALAAGWVWLAM
ncbi:MAG TPA: SLC13 family permease, partial [Planctomycetota bacterium]|nr:SLC13 family permease [Planctomycetota bacterium]